MKQDDDTDQELSDDESEDPGESSLLSNIPEDDSDHQQEVLLLGQARQDKTLQTTRVPLPKKWSRSDTVIGHAPLPNSRNPDEPMAPPLLKRQKSNLLNKLSKSDRAPSTQMLSLCTSRGDLNVPQPKASADQNVPQYQTATFEVVNRFMEAIVFTKIPLPDLSNYKYSMGEEAWTLPIDAQNGQQALAGAPVGTPSVCQMPDSPSLKIDPQTREAVGLGFCLMLHYQISVIDYALK